jgi:hypothetical protein
MTTLFDAAPRESREHPTPLVVRTQENAQLRRELLAEVLRLEDRSYLEHPFPAGHEVGAAPGLLDCLVQRLHLPEPMVFSSGITPASDSFVALTITMTFMALFSWA